MTLKERVASVPYWYHRIELPDGVVTPGWAPLAPQAYRIPADLTGKRVLDVGAWDGYWTFEALKRGASEAIAIDDFSDALGGKARTEWATFNLCRAAFGYGEDRCKGISMSVYEAQQLGEFDTIFFFGTFYHLRHPMLALETLSSICRESIYVESAICDDYSPYIDEPGQSGLGRGYGNKMVMEFYPTNELAQNPTNWWSPTLRTLAHMVRACGWSHVCAWKLAAQPKELPWCRGFVKAGKGGPAA